MANLVCDGVAKSYGARQVLSELSLEVPSGTMTAILGSSGAGKTTLLRVVMGLERLDEGRIEVGDRVLGGPGTHVAPERRAIGYLSQEGALFPQLSVAGNVGFGLERAARRSADRIAHLLELVGLDPSFAERSPRELSGGEQRRVALARALAPRPQLVLLDEPFSGLDAALRVETAHAVLNALGEQGATALLVTHDQDEALSLGREVGVLRDGLLVQVAAPEVLYREPLDADIARFVGEATFIDATVEGAMAHCALGTLEVRAPALQGPVQVMIRPDQFMLSDSPSDARTPAQVCARRYRGADVTISARLTQAASGATELLAVCAGIGAPQVGATVFVEVLGPVIAFTRPQTPARVE
jgi:iron(III) transport system ATP-binding protein